MSSNQERPTDGKRKLLGIVTQGSLSQGLEMRLDAEHSVEDLRVGRFVVIEGTKSRFFSMLTDVSLAATNSAILSDPPQSDPFLRRVLSGVSTYGAVKLQPMLMLENSSTGEDLEAVELRPVKTVPSHFSQVFEADARDFALVFGQEDAANPRDARFSIGQPLNMDVPVCVDLGRFIERSNGIFGKSGTGKSFLTRIFLCGMIKKDVASVLVFDMHNEYGWQAVSENRSAPRVKGLKQLFGNKVVVFSLDQELQPGQGAA